MSDADSKLGPLIETLQRTASEETIKEARSKNSMYASDSVMAVVTGNETHMARFLIMYHTETGTPQKYLVKHGHNPPEEEIYSIIRNPDQLSDWEK